MKCNFLNEHITNMIVTRPGPISDDNHPHLSCKMALLAVLLLVTHSVSGQTISDLIEKRIEQYREAYPDIEFQLLNSMSDYDPLLPLTDSLGEDLSNVDYEHPDEVRITLVEVQEYRIETLLINGYGSATLFKTPHARITKKPYTCLITLDSHLLDESPLAATRFMYDLDEATLDSMPESFHLDNRVYSLFSIDHELFHCIDAYTNGYMYHRNWDPVMSDHDRYRSELRAEIFAARAHLSRHSNGRAFLTSLATARILNLLSGDVQHYTSTILQKLLVSDEQNINDDIKSLAEESMRYAENVTPSYTDHKEFLSVYRVALQEFGIDTEDLLTDFPDLADETPLPEKVEALVNAIKTAMSAIRSR